MSEPMKPVRISIPAAEQTVAHHAASVVIAKLRSLGADPMAVGRHPFAAGFCQAWVRGEMDDAGFERGIENLMILNSTFRAQS